MNFVLPTVALALDVLDRPELIALLMNTHLQNDPRGIAGYDKIAYLWDQEDGTKMSDLTREAVQIIASQRLREETV